MVVKLFFLFTILLHLCEAQNCPPLTTRDVEGPFYESSKYLPKVLQLISAKHT